MTDTIQGALAEFLRLTDERKAVEAELQRVKDELAAADRQLRAHFEHIGVAHLRTVDGRTVYVSRELHAGAKGGDRVAVTKALLAAGLPELVTENYNANTLSAYVREMDRNEESLPEALAEAIEVTELFRLRVRSS